ncbi:hypothetical protein D9M71_635380 [compost metagenome]
MRRAPAVADIQLLEVALTVEQVLLRPAQAQEGAAAFVIQFDLALGVGDVEVRLQDVLPAQANATAFLVGFVPVEADHIGVFPDFGGGGGKQAGAQVAQAADALTHTDAEGAVLGQEIFQFGATEDLRTAIGKGIGQAEVHQHP